MLAKRNLQCQRPIFGRGMSFFDKSASLITLIMEQLPATWQNSSVCLMTKIAACYNLGLPLCCTLKAFKD